MAWDFIACSGKDCLAVINSKPHYHFKNSSTNETSPPIFSLTVAIEFWEAIIAECVMPLEHQEALLTVVAQSELTVPETDDDRLAKRQYAEMFSLYFQTAEPNPITLLAHSTYTQIPLTN